MTVTRDALEKALDPGYPTWKDLTPARAYAQLTDHLGYDLADVINLGLAALGTVVWYKGTRREGFDEWLAGQDFLLDSIFARAEVERRTT